MLNELKKVPRGFAAFLVLGAAVVTMLVLAAFDSTVGTGRTDGVQPVAKRTQTEVIVLGKKYPKRRAAAPATPAPPQEQEAPPATPTVPMRRLIGQKLIVRMSGTSPAPDLLRRVRRGDVGGVILFPDNVGSAAQLRSLTGRLQQAAQAGGAPGFVIAVDQEGGPVKRLSAGPPNRSPAQIATAASGREEGRATGAYLTGLGINVDLAPVLDVPAPGSFIASRAFAHTPARVADLGGAFAQGLGDAGVAATAKHFPGLGYATANTDNGPSVVGASKPLLDADLAPFQRAIAGGVPLVMMSNATYPAYGAGPAVLSPAVVTGVLRNRLRFGGVIVTDDLEAGAVRASLGPGAAAVAASKAGVDMFLLARSTTSFGPAHAALMAAARSGDLDRGALEQSYERIQRLQSSYAK